MTSPTTILAAHLGLGDALPDELAQMVDSAFRANYNANLGRHAVMVPFHMNGSDVVQGKTLEGDEAKVIVTASTAGRSFAQTIALADVWRLPAAGSIDLEAVEPAFTAIAVFGLAESVDPHGRIWATAFWDQRDAAVALLNPEVFRGIVGTGNDARRLGQVQLVDRSLTSTNAQVIAASTAQEYLAGQRESLTDGGQRPVWWVIQRFEEEFEVAASNGPSIDDSGPHRRYGLRSKVAGAVVGEVTGRSKPYAMGSLWSQQPLNWRDPTGETAVALADGDITMRDLLAGEVVTPDRADARTALGTVVDRLLDAGLTERQAWIYANDQAGFSQREIAAAFKVTTSTVSNTVAACRRKLGQQQP